MRTIVEIRVEGTKDRATNLKGWLFEKHKNKELPP